MLVSSVYDGCLSETEAQKEGRLQLRIQITNLSPPRSRRLIIVYQSSERGAVVRMPIVGWISLAFLFHFGERNSNYSSLSTFHITRRNLLHVIE